MLHIADYVHDDFALKFLSSTSILLAKLFVIAVPKDEKEIKDILVAKLRSQSVALKEARNIDDESSSPYPESEIIDELNRMREVITRQKFDTKKQLYCVHQKTESIRHNISDFVFTSAIFRAQNFQLSLVK